MQELVLVSILFLFSGKISMIIDDIINNKIQTKTEYQYTFMVSNRALFGVNKHSLIQ